MALNTVTLNWDLADLVQAGIAAKLLIAPTQQLSDVFDGVTISTVPRPVNFTGTGQLAGIVANDSQNIQPSGTGYTISVVAANGQVILPAATYVILFANGATQNLAGLPLLVPPAVPPPYVLPGAAGYLGAASALTPYAPPGSGQPGAGVAPPGCTWGAGPTFGLNCSVSNMLLDHVQIYGAINFTGKVLSVSNSVILGGTGTEFYCIWHNGTGAAGGGVIAVTDSTLGWLPAAVYPSADDVAVIRDTNGPFYEIVRCDISGTPQGLNPGTGLVFRNWIHGLVQPNPSGPTHLDGIFMQGGSDLAICANYVDVPIRTDTTAAIFLQAGGAIPGVIVDSNFLRGGSFTLRNENGTGMVVTGNTFGGGVFGDAANIGADGGTINTWYNNTTAAGATVPNPYTPVVTMAVTATETGSAANGIAMQVKVLTGAKPAASQPMSNAVGLTQASPRDAAITPLATGSWIYGSQLGLAGTYTVDGATTTKQDVAVAGLEMLSYRSSTTTTAATPVTVGYTASVNSIAQVLAEIEASGTLAEDASSPAGVSASGASNVATASFSPPPSGALLVAMIQSNGGGSVTTMTVTDSSGLGRNGYCGIWIAQVIIP